MNSDSRKSIWIKLCLLAIDAVMILASAVLASLLLSGSVSERFITIAVFTALCNLVLLVCLKFYRYKLLKSSIELSLYSFIAFASVCFLGAIIFIVSPINTKSDVSFLIVYQVFAFLAVLGYRVLYIVANRYLGKKKGRQYPTTLVYGAGEIGNTLAHQFNYGKLEYDIIGFIDDSPALKNRYIQGIQVLGTVFELSKIIERFNVKTLIVGITELPKEKLYKAIDIAKDHDCDIKIIPSLYELQNGSKELDLRNLDYKDLLGRSLIQVDRAPIEAMVKNKVALVTGACGSIGSEICKQLVSFGVRQLVMIDIDESGLHDQGLRLSGYRTEISDMIVPILCDIKNKKKVEKILAQFKPDIVYHAAAYKHVPMGEREPDEIIRNNVMGSYNVLNAAKLADVKKVVVISTDKAVNPTNVMGASKRMVELVASMLNDDKTEIVAVRFGNVLGSRGSMLPLFIEQIQNGVPITVTHKDIIRYFMAIPEAVSLVLKAGAMARGGEVMVLDMGQPVRIYDFAQRLIKYYGDSKSKIVVTGLRPGEKLYEELLADEDLTIPTDDKLVFKARLNEHKLNPEEFYEFNNNIDDLSEEQLVDKLKHFVPEFACQNSKRIING